MNQKIIKLFSGLFMIVTLVLLIYMAIKYVPDLTLLTRPCAFSAILRMLNLTGVMVLFAINTFIKTSRKVINNLLIVIFFASFACTVSEGLQVDYLKYWSDYDIALLILCAYFLLLFFCAYFNKHHHVIQSLLCIAYIAVTIIYQAKGAGHNNYGIYYNEMILILPMLTVFSVVLFKSNNKVELQCDKQLTGKAL